MSLAIDSRTIVGIYALNQWFKVKPFSVWIDAYELNHVDTSLTFEETKFGTSGNKYNTYIQLSYLYPDFEWTPTTNFSTQYGDEASFENPSANQGVGAILDNGAEIEEAIYFCILEVKAFKCLSREDALALSHHKKN
tara:strand:- start:500 stop:910 length:411 start_codon:yes stop_codon:yes gene_type:complete